jgi:hypothetical protein
MASATIMSTQSPSRHCSSGIAHESNLVNSCQISSSQTTRKEYAESDSKYRSLYNDDLKHLRVVSNQTESLLHPKLA